MSLVAFLGIVLLAVVGVAIYRSRLINEAKATLCSVVFLVILGIIIAAVPTIEKRGLPITELENGQVYLTHFDYTDWDNPDPSTPVFLELAEKPGEEPLHYRIPRYQLMNSEDEPFVEGQRIYPAFLVKKTKNTAKENIYLLEPLASSFPMTK